MYRTREEVYADWCVVAECRGKSPEEWDAHFCEQLESDADCDGITVKWTDTSMSLFRNGMTRELKFPFNEDDIREALDALCR